MRTISMQLITWDNAFYPNQWKIVFESKQRNLAFSVISLGRQVTIFLLSAP